MIRLDGDAVRDARLDLGLSLREVSRSSGIGAAALRNIETDQETGTEITVVMLQRLVDTLGVRLRDLLADDTPGGPNRDRAHAPEHDPTDDVPALADLLLHARVSTHRKDLADGLDWTLDRLRLAAASLDHDLRPLGMQVHTLNGGYVLRPLGGYTNARKRIERRNTAENGMTAPAARLVHEALTTGLTVKSIGQARRADLGRLLRDGVLAENGTDYTPGHALRDAVDVPG